MEEQVVYTDTNRSDDNKRCTRYVLYVGKHHPSGSLGLIGYEDVSVHEAVIRAQECEWVREVVGVTKVTGKNLGNMPTGGWPFHEVIQVPAQPIALEYGTDPHAKVRLIRT